MGREKAFLPVGGREMLDRVLAAGRSACAACVLVVRETAPFEEALRRYGWEAAARRTPRFRRGDTGLRLVTDRHPGLGPVAGLETGLEAAAGPLCFAAACDLPFLSGSVVAALLERLDALRAETGGGEDSTGSGTDVSGDRPTPDGGLAVVPVAAGRRQPLAAAYTAGCAAAARRCVEEEELSMDSLLARLDVVRETPAADLAPEGEAGGDADAGRPFSNVNRPEDLRAARRFLAPEGSPAPGEGP